MRRVAPAVLLVSPLLLLGCGERTHSCCVTDDVGYRAEFGEGHDARQAELECQGTLEAGACPREGVVGQCVHQIEIVTRNGRATTVTKSWQENTGETTITTESPMGRISEKVLDDKGRVIEQMYGDNLPVVFEYDDTTGQLDFVTQGSRKLDLEYNARGLLWKLIQARNPNSSSDDRITEFGYDLNDRPSSRTTPDGRLISYSFNGSGSMTKITPPGRSPHELEYSGVDLLTSYAPPPPDPTDATPRSTLYGYNLDRQLTKVIRPPDSDPNDPTVTIEYDDVTGRLESRYERGSLGFDVGYDAVGRIETITSPDDVTLTYGYDSVLANEPLVEYEQWSGLVVGKVSRKYNSDFRVEKRWVNTLPEVEFSYDDDGLLTGAGALSIVRDPLNGRVDQASAGVVVFTHSQADLGFESTETTTTLVNGSEFYYLALKRDDLGRVYEKTERIEGVEKTLTYEYDDAGRLEEVLLDAVSISTYSYDQNGGRFCGTPQPGPLPTVCDDQDRLVTYGDYTYGWTAAGELLSKVDTTGNTTEYEYDHFGNLRRVTFPPSEGDVQIEYLIDGRNRRVGKKRDGVLEQAFLYQDQLNPIAELDGNGNVVATFVYGTKPHVPDLIIKNGVTYRVLTDHLGSVRFVVNTLNGVVAQEMSYDVWGAVVQDTDPGFQPFGFAGGLYDQDTGLVRFGARDYDPYTGRWTAKDPILFAAGDTNLYGYVLQDPVNLADPSGLVFEDLTPYESYLIGELMANSQIGQFVEAMYLHPDVRIHLRELAYRDADYGGLTEKIDCAPDCGGTADIAISYCPLLASEELETLGLEFTDLQLIAHELGHAFAMFSALVENDPSYVSGEAFNEWSLLFENAVRDDILRGVH